MKTNFKSTILLMTVMLLTSSFFVSCEKDNEPEVVISVVTNPIVITSITQTTAIGGGSVTVTGNVTITEKGVCYSTNQNPTIGDNKVPSGSGTGTFTSNITGLSANTTYYVRAYATNSAGTSYGEQVSFTTKSVVIVAPTITTAAVTNFTQTTAVSGGNITSNGNGTITASGVCYSTNQNPTVNDLKVSSTTTIGSFTSLLSGLSLNTTYYVRAYATNSAGTSYGEQVSFTTLPQPVLPTVVTMQMKNITPNSATCVGNITSDGNSVIIQRGVVFSTQPNPTVKANSSKTDNLFEIELTNLKPNTTYYVKAYAENSVGIGYGNEITFTTSNITVGMSYLDGIVGYIFKSGDSDYVVGEIHGLIVKSVDQSNGTTWENAKTLCTNLGTGWYLPSFTELYNIWTNRSIIGGFSSGQYWSSDTDYAVGANYAKTLYFNNGSNEPTQKTQTFVKVRAVKKF